MARVAVIGSGISGMAAAYFVSRKHEVSLFEKEDRLGGHTHTHQIETSRNDFYSGLGASTFAGGAPIVPGVWASFQLADS